MESAAETTFVSERLSPPHAITQAATIKSNISGKLCKDLIFRTFLRMKGYGNYGYHLLFALQIYTIILDTTTFWQKNIWRFPLPSCFKMVASSL